MIFTCYIDARVAYLLCFAVGLAAVIDVARDVALLGGIDDLISVQRHEVEVFRGGVSHRT